MYHNSVVISEKFDLSSILCKNQTISQCIVIRGKWQKCVFPLFYLGSLYSVKQVYV